MDGVHNEVDGEFRRRWFLIAPERVNFEIEVAIYKRKSRY